MDAYDWAINTKYNLEKIKIIIIIKTSKETKTQFVHTGAPYSFQVPSMSFQYQCHSVVHSRMFGGTVLVDTVVRRRTLLLGPPVAVIVLKFTITTSELKKSTTTKKYFKKNINKVKHGGYKKILQKKFNKVKHGCYKKIL